MCLKLTGILLLIIGSSILLPAQPGPGGLGISASLPGVIDSNGPVVPFDGGMSLMLAASGISYVAKRMKKKDLDAKN